MPASRCLSPSDPPWTCDPRASGSTRSSTATEVRHVPLVRLDAGMPVPSRRHAVRLLAAGRQGDRRAGEQVAPPAGPLCACWEASSTMTTSSHFRTPSASGAERCFVRYFKGIPADRVGTVESGTTSYDVIAENQTKAGQIGMTFTHDGRPVGAIRFELFPENLVFKIESIVDARCRVIEDYESR